MKKIVVTTSWDDGHKLDLKLAMLLKKYGIKGTFYISPENREFKKSDLLTNQEIKTLAQDFEIGTHTMTHPVLTKISLLHAEKEIRDSKKYLENILNKKINAFCYPGGKFNYAVREMVSNSGLKMARTTKRFADNIGGDPFSLPTTVHVYTHLQDLFNVPNIFSYKTFLWDRLAKLHFDTVYKHGGVFHLWGHAWEIEKLGFWYKLENVFAYIGNKKNVDYTNNSDLVK